MDETKQELTFEESVNGFRKRTKEVAVGLKSFKEKMGDTELAEKEDRGEVLANLMLSYRHLEDASMRLGKVLQARDGGVSVYDKETTI